MMLANGTRMRGCEGDFTDSYPQLQVVPEILTGALRERPVFRSGPESPLDRYPAAASPADHSCQRLCWQAFRSLDNRAYPSIPIRCQVCPVVISEKPLHLARLNQNGNDRYFVGCCGGGLVLTPGRLAIAGRQNCQHNIRFFDHFVQFGDERFAGRYRCRVCPDLKSVLGKPLCKPICPRPVFPGITNKHLVPRHQAEPFLMISPLQRTRSCTRHGT